MAVKVDLSEDGQRINLRADFRFKELCKTVPGLKWHNKESIWSMPLSWSGCLALRSTFRSDLDIGPKLTAWAINERTTRIDPSMALRDVIHLEEGDTDLYSYQRAGVAFLATARRALLADEPGTGKALAMSERVLTPSGFVEMRHIKLGHSVVGADGSATTVTGVHPQGLRDIYTVRFSDGSTARVDLEHLWQVENARTGHTRTVTTGWMVERGLRRSDGHRKFRIPLVKSVVFEPRGELLYDPYVMGILLGDGSFAPKGDTRFSSGDSEIVDYVQSTGLRLTRDGAYGYNMPGCRSKTKHYGLSGATSSLKWVPEEYLYASAQDRLSVVRGLMDSDGWVSRNGMTVQYTSVSPLLIEGMTHLVRSLGGVVTLTEKDIPRGGNYKVYTLTLNTPFNPFRLERKASLWVPRSKYPARRYVDSIELSGVEEAQCIEVAAEDHLFVMNDFIVTHNTVTSIRALKKLQDAGEPVFPLLVVCPNSLKLNWKREFEKWWPEINVQVVHGTATQRRKQFKPFLEPSEDEPMPQVIISNWEGLRGHSRLAPSGSIALVRCVECGGADDSVSLNRCEVHLRELNMIDFKSVIADEIHRSKQPKAKQTRALWAATGDADIRFALTGTPIASDVVDLWSILHWLDPNEWPSKTRWIDRMVNTMMNAFGGLVVIGIKPTMKDEFFAALHPRMRRMLKAVVLPQLPPVVLTRRDVEMSPKQRTAYNQMRDKMIAEIEGEYLSATTPLTQTIRLIQFASAYAEVEVNEDTGETKTILTEPSAKIDSLMDDISSGDFGDSSVAVSAVSRQLIDLLSARLTKAKIPHGLITGTCSAEDRQKAVDDFQNGRIKWILFTAQAGGVGITLTAAKYLVRLQRPWSLVDDKQVNDRVHRIGSEIHDSVIILDYVTAGTIEERVAEVLGEKGENFEEVVKDKEKLLAALKGTKVF